MSGFHVFTDTVDATAGPSVHIRVDYPSGVRPEEVASAVSTAARKAFEEIEVRIGPLPEIER